MVALGTLQIAACSCYRLAISECIHANLYNSRITTVAQGVYCSIRQVTPNHALCSVPNSAPLRQAQCFMQHPPPPPATTPSLVGGGSRCAGVSPTVKSADSQLAQLTGQPHSGTVIPHGPSSATPSRSRPSVSQLSEPPMSSYTYGSTVTEQVKEQPFCSMRRPNSHTCQAGPSSNLGSRHAE
jgi:hypothetical protein